MDPAIQERTPELDLIADYACETGEGPLWHPTEKRLYWTDIPTGRLFRYDPASRHHEQIYDDRPVGGFTFQADGGLLLFRDRGNITLWRDGEFTELLSEIPAERDSRFNDVIADPQGRVFCGTMPTKQGKGRLYRLDPDGTLTPILHFVGMSNGMGFSPDLKTFYHTDSVIREIRAFDYDADTGGIDNQRLFARIHEEVAVPDGLTVDRSGRVWSALWDGSSILRFDPDGRPEARFCFPTPKVSCLTFAGEDFNDIYITTAGGDVRETDGPQAGVLFHTRLDATGRPEFFSRIESRSVTLRD